MAASTAVVIMEFEGTVTGSGGGAYVARACGRVRDTGQWEGWLEFSPAPGGAVLRSRRETTQPSLEDLQYWATGLSDVYLEGSLARSLTPPLRRESPADTRPAYDGPAPDIVEAAPAVADYQPRAVLDPFAAYAQGEDVLRRGLGALDAEHLVSIVKAYGLSGEPNSVLDRLSAPALVHLIVDAVRSAVSASARRAPDVTAEGRGGAT